MESAGGPKRSHFHLPWRHTSEEQEAAKNAERQRQAELEQLIGANREAEASRQAADLQLLGSGGIPTMATQRLAALRDADPKRALLSGDLSPAEVAVLRCDGYRALGVVSGSVSSGLMVTLAAPVKTA